MVDFDAAGFDEFDSGLWPPTVSATCLRVRPVVAAEGSEGEA